MAAKFRAQMAEMGEAQDRGRQHPLVAAVPPVSATRSSSPGTAGPAAATTETETEFAAGVYELDDNTYHGDPLRRHGSESLSATWARWLVAPSTPARYRWLRDHPQADTESLTFGKAVHRCVLGAGPSLALFDGGTWRTAKGRQFRADALAAGSIPVKSRELAQIEQIAAAVKAHPVAGPCFVDGKAEQAMFARDPDTGVWLRGRADYLKTLPSGDLLIVDLKTTDKSAAPQEFGRTIADYKYHRQAAWYEMLARLIGLAQRIVVLFVVVEKDPPFLVAVHQLKPSILARGHQVNQVAIRTFAACLASGEWPGYPLQINQISSLPVWCEYEEDNILEGVE